ncbi:FGGY family carbohydrate kinase [Sinorhizobium sp. CB9]
MASDERESEATIAVLDIGKTNVKLSAVSETGTVVEVLSVVNAVNDAPPWRHHDLDGLGDWIFATLAQLARRHPIASIVCSGHGSGGVLTFDDPDRGNGAALPMIDYEQPLPDDIRDAYTPQSGSFFDRGSAIMLGATHQARQMYWMQQEQPEAFARACWFLGIPQYWAWRLSGVAVSEVSYLGAQSHLWNVVERHWTPIVEARGWHRLMPPFANAWDTIGTIRPALAARHGLRPALKVLAGGHDSSLNYYRYQAAGLRNFALVSTGTWIVGLCDATPLSDLDEHRGMTCNSDVSGVPLGGVLCMGGREFSRVAGADAPQADVEFDTLVRLVEQGTMAMPSFSDDDGLFPGSAGRGRYLGPLPESPAERKALALLYCALLTCECLNALGSASLVVLDGSFVRDPLYARLVAAISQRKLLYNLDSAGVTAGAALLVGHIGRSRPAPINLCEPAGMATFQPVLDSYVKRWRSLTSRIQS